MKKLLLIMVLLGESSTFALTPAQVQGVLKTLERDKTQAKKLCPQLCTNLAATIAPDVTCSVCYQMCFGKAKRKDLGAQSMMKTCTAKSYPVKCCAQISSKCAKQGARINQLKVSVQGLKLKIQPNQNKIVNLTQQVAQEKQKFIDKERQFKTTLQNKEKEHKDDLHLKETKYAFIVKNLRTEIKGYEIPCDKAVLSTLESSAPNKFWSLFQVDDFLNKFSNKYLGKQIKFSSEDDKLLEKAISSLQIINMNRVQHVSDLTCQEVLYLARGYNEYGEPMGNLTLFGISVNLGVIRSIGNLYESAKTGLHTRKSAKELFIHAQKSLKSILKRTKDYLDFYQTGRYKGGVYLSNAQWDAIPKKIRETL